MLCTVCTWLEQSDTKLNFTLWIHMKLPNDQNLGRWHWS